MMMMLMVLAAAIVIGFVFGAVFGMCMFHMPAIIALLGYVREAAMELLGRPFFWLMDRIAIREV